MSTERMLKARELIAAKRYAEARAILETIDHPKAKEWLAKLDVIAPNAAQPNPTSPSRKKPGRRYFVVYGLIFILFLGGILYGTIQYLEAYGQDGGEDVIRRITTIGPRPNATYDAVGTEMAEMQILTETYAAENSRETPDPVGTWKP